MKPCDGAQPAVVWRSRVTSVVPARGILFGPLAPIVHDLPTNLNDTPILVLDGVEDNRRSPGDNLHVAKPAKRQCSRTPKDTIGGSFSARPNQLATPSTMNARDFVVFMRIAFISVMAADAYHALAFSSVSKA
jgi:hypothetical protein